MKKIGPLIFLFLFQLTSFTFWGQTLSKDSLAALYFTQGDQYLHKANFDSADHYLYQALDLFIELEKKAEEANTHKSIAGIFHFQGNFKESISHLQKAQNIYEEIGEYEKAAGLLINISMSYFSQKRFKDALAKALSAVKIGEEKKSDDILGRAYLMAGQGHEALENFEKAHQYYEKSLPILKAANNPVHLAVLYNVSGHTLYQQGSYSESLNNLELAFNIYKEIGHQRGISEVNRTKGLVLTKMGRHKKALQIHEVNLAYFQENNDLKSVATTYSYMALSYEGLGDYQQAFESQVNYTALNDSILGEKRISEIAELETRFETQKKENEILKLENEKTDAKIKSDRQQQIIVSGLIGLILIAAVAFLFFRNAKNTKKINELLSQKNEEKEFLIKEIHHRVKNNLQILSSLLNLQSKYIKDENAFDAVIDGRNRVQSMSLIHQKLYMGENMAAVDMNDYINELSEHLLDTFGVKNERVKINSQIDVPELDVDTAIPLGLIINELVTNSMKYAFPDNNSGEIIIELKIKDSNNLYLKIADDGVGKNASSSSDNSTLFGGNLVKILSKKLKGKITQNDEDGFETIIEFERYKINDQLN